MKPEYRKTASLALAAIFFSGVAQADQTDDRVVREARALFRVVLAKESSGKGGSPERCEYSDRWDPAAVPQYVAREYFGVTVRADLTADPPFGYSQPKKVLDPEGQHPEAFCSEDEQKENRRALREAFTKGTKLAREHSNYSSAVINRTYSFPVFDRKFRRAAFVRGNFFSSFMRRREGEGVADMPLEFVIWAVVYEKRNGVWQEIDTFEMAIT